MRIRNTDKKLFKKFTNECVSAQLAAFLRFNKIKEKYYLRSVFGMPWVQTRQRTTTP